MWDPCRSDASSKRPSPRRRTGPAWAAAAQDVPGPSVPT
ncbi:hypothetical protein F8B43_4330 [Methylorubrum populi]|uniref:Uncharacterized protein n=1 Tax=Methylorubrum populi TaxID=223967 RepID=A0A833J3N2_9HYPH|nr:hypothetical protein F8B43_4330 [Methylorubrum populi]